MKSQLEPVRNDKGPVVGSVRDPSRGSLLGALVSTAVGKEMGGGAEF